MRNYRNASGCASKNSVMRSEHSAIGKNPENTMKFSMFKEIEKLTSKAEENFMAVACSLLWVHFHSRWDQEVQDHTFIPEGPVTGVFCCSQRLKCNDHAKNKECEEIPRHMLNAERAEAQTTKQ